ncbi:putative ATP-dependent endonuclease of OLD family [Staphylococcus caledonicus]|uniref:ATP-dependent nuclease n=1 Tax=Staphylococcus caledonicus TaxID=2741333 RepID=UPI003C2AECA7
MLFNIDFALSKSQKNSNITLIEEPESHLSQLNMHKLIEKITNSNGMQIFIATHSNMIATRLDLQKVIFLANGKATKLEELDKETARFFMKAPNSNVLDFILANKIILVEGNAEYILLSALFTKKLGTELYNKDITIISVGGLSFKRYLNIAKKLNKKVAIITDNDRDYDRKVTESYKDYQSDNIQIFAPKDNNDFTFEVSIYNNNQKLLDSTLKTDRMKKGFKDYMLSNKAEAAFKILEKLATNEFYEEFTIPSHITEAYEWIN